MQVELETASGLKRRLVITISSDEVEDKVNKRLQDLSKRVRLDGFRPGKTPMKVVRRRYGADTRQEVLGEIMQASFLEAIEQEKLNPVAAPTVETKSNEEGQDFQFVASFEVYPEIELSDFSSIKVERPVSSVADADVDEMIDTLKKQACTYEEVERPAEMDDQVTFDYKGMIDGEVFEGGSAENTDLVLGSGRMISGFEDGLLGVSAGDEKVLSLTFPTNYNAPDLAGKEAEFACKVHKVSGPVMPEMNSTFFEKFGVMSGDMDSFRSEVKKNMDRELRQAVKGKVKHQVMEGLLACHNIDVPTPLVEQQIDSMREEAFRNLGGEKGGFEASAIPAELFEAGAKKRVALGLLIREIVKSRDVKVDDGRVRTMIEELASAYQEPQQVVDWYYGNEEQLSQIKYIVLEEQVMDSVLDSATVSEKEFVYKDAIKPIEEVPESKVAEASEVSEVSAEQAPV